MDKTFTFDSYGEAALFVYENDKKFFIVSEEEWDDLRQYYAINFIVCDEAEANRLVGLSHEDKDRGTGDIFQIFYRPSEKLIFWPW